MPGLRISYRDPGLTLIYVVAFCLISQPVLAQRSLDVVFLEQAPTINGEIGEAEWADSAVTSGAFVQIQPEFGDESPFRTVVRVGQTATALYIAFEAFDPDSARLAAAVTTRDGGVGSDDSVAVALDSFGDNRTAYVFQTNALATQEDSRIADNGRTVDKQWDTAWSSAAMRHEDRWTAEFEIPFSILRYSTESDASWGVNFVRTVPRRLETSLWSGPDEVVWRVSSFGDLNQIELQPQNTNAWDFIPYALGAFEKDTDPNYEAGLDVRWRPSSRLGVDLTLNPDFALVEADVEEINLTRFELRVPEKRPFFLEGSEMFNQRYRQFYSRRIGDITWGAKASGKIGETDFSALATSEDRMLEGGIGEVTADYSVVRLQHGLSRGSNIGLLAANRSLQGENAGSVGLDTTMYFTDAVSMTGQLLRAHGPTADGGLAWFIRPSWDTATSHFHVRLGELEANIRDDLNAVGFFTDDDRKTFDTNASHTFWFDGGAIANVRPVVNYNRYRSQEDVLRSEVLNARVQVIFRNGWELALRHIDEFKLFEKEFDNDRTVLDVGWDGRDGRSISTYVGSGYNFDNDISIYGAVIEWPFGDRLRLTYDVSRLEQEPDLENESTTIHVLEVLYSFNPDLFVKFFVQTNSAIDKENVQLLGVWRFKPPFGSVQVAYQRGTSQQGLQSQQGDTFFTKFSWVF